MSVGYPDNKAAMDARAGGLAIQARDLFAAVGNFQAYLASKTDSELVTLGYTQGEVTLLKSAFTQLDALRLVATGQQTVPAANNFLFNSNKLVGPN